MMEHLKHDRKEKKLAKNQRNEIIACVTTTQLKYQAQKELLDS